MIVADDASTDATAEIARTHGARVLDVRFRHIARTRNAGAKSAAGDRLKSQARFPNPIRAATSQQSHSVVLSLTSEPVIDWQFDLTHRRLSFS